MNSENNTKKDLPPELPEELLAEVSGGIISYSDKKKLLARLYGGIGDSDKGYLPLGNYSEICEFYQFKLGICENYQFKYAPSPNKCPDNCLLCRYFQYDVPKNALYCTYPDDYMAQ